jgi:hypothetical protein
VSDDPSLKLTFSCDTLRFDTLVTEQGSATAQLKVYNRNASAMLIERIWQDGNIFRINIDGEPDAGHLNNLQINGGDSLFVFVRVMPEANGVNNPVLTEDVLHFHLSSGATQNVHLEAYTQDVARIGRAGCKRTLYNDLTFNADKPYLIFDTLIISGTLTMDAGARLFMHSGACIYALGDVSVNGTKEQPVLVRGDRLDRYSTVFRICMQVAVGTVFICRQKPHVRMNFIMRIFFREI